MASESIITATFGVPGSGKTYSRVRFLVDDFLVNCKGLYITNIPLNVEVISEYVSKKLSCSCSDISSRIVIIPDDVTIYWEKLNQLENRDLQTFDSESFPPSHFLQQYDLDGAHIAIDEFHKYFSKKGPKLLKKLWNDWFAEIRKTGCTFEAVTQSYGQMSEEFLDKCATRTELINHADFRDPIFHIRMGDWYELRAGLFKTLSLQRVSERETRRGSTDSGRVTWQNTGKFSTYTLDPFYFQFYDSFHNSTGSSGSRQTPADMYGRKIFIWFFRRNFLSIFTRCIAAALIYFFLLGGGVSWSIKHFVNALASSGRSNNPSVPSLDSQGHNINVSKSRSLSPGKVTSSRSDPVPDLSGFVPVCFFNNKVFLKNGLVVYEGFVFSDGYFKGKSVNKVDSLGRFCRLSDGHILRMQ